MRTTADQRPASLAAGPKWSASGSLRASASDTVVVKYSKAVASRPTATGARVGETRATEVSASVAAAPAGSHASAMRPSGCGSWEASCSSGRAPA
jgi:hypothetical protein